jgi:hypothetical protein
MRRIPRSSLAARSLPALATSLALVCAPTVDAHATPNFPPAIQSYVGAASPPDCLVCHNTEAGGIGTVTTTFGLYMISRGLVAYDVSSLQTALSADKAERHASNGNGTDDIDALAKDLDPNVGTSGGASSQSSPPTYGCNVGRIAVGYVKAPLSGSFVAMASLLWLAVLRRSKRAAVRASGAQD